MTPELQSALIGLAGGLVGVAIGAMLQHKSSHAQLRRQLTLQFYDRFEATELLQSRIAADRLLAANLASPTPKSYSELYATLPPADWQHISSTRHFFDQLGVLHEIGYLDISIARPVFGSYAAYWADHYFDRLEQLEAAYATSHSKPPMKWLVPSKKVMQLFQS